MCGKLGVLVWAVGNLESRLAAGEDRADTAEALVCETLDKMFELSALIEGLHGTVGVKREHVAELVHANLIRIQLVITAALSESEGMVSEAICCVRDRLPVEALSGARGPVKGVLLIGPRSCSLNDLLFLPNLYKYC